MREPHRHAIDDKAPRDLIHALLRANSGVLNRWRNLSSPLRNARSVSAATSTGENASVGVSPVASSRRKSASTSSASAFDPSDAARRESWCEEGCSASAAVQRAARHIASLCIGENQYKTTIGAICGLAIAFNCALPIAWRACLAEHRTEGATKHWKRDAWTQDSRPQLVRLSRRRLGQETHLWCAWTLSRSASEQQVAEQLSSAYNPAVGNP